MQTRKHATSIKKLWCCRAKCSRSPNLTPGVRGEPITAALWSSKCQFYACINIFHLTWSAISLPKLFWCNFMLLKALFCFVKCVWKLSDGLIWKCSVALFFLVQYFGYNFFHQAKERKLNHENYFTRNKHICWCFGGFLTVSMCMLACWC